MHKGTFPLPPIPLQVRPEKRVGQTGGTAAAGAEGGAVVVNMYALQCRYIADVLVIIYSANFLVH
jgi:hypothetical protein